MTYVKKQLAGITPTDETREYYNSVKAYYTELGVYRDFAEKYPAGYSKLTYSQTLSSIRDNVNRAKTDVSFYK